MIAEQEPDVTVADNLRWWYRSGLTWSPDNTRLVYFQYHNSFDKINLTRQLPSFNVLTISLPRLWAHPSQFVSLSWSGDNIVADTTVITSAGAPIAKYYLNEWMTSNYAIALSGSGLRPVIDSSDVIPHDGRVLYNRLADRYVWGSRWHPIQHQCANAGKLAGVAQGRQQYAPAKGG